MLSRFHLIPERHRKTDSVLTRDKNYFSNVLSNDNTILFCYHCADAIGL